MPYWLARYAVPGARANIGIVRSSRHPQHRPVRLTRAWMSASRDNQSCWSPCSRQSSLSTPCAGPTLRRRTPSHHPFRPAGRDRQKQHRALAAPGVQPSPVGASRPAATSRRQQAIALIEETAQPGRGTLISSDPILDFFGKCSVEVERQADPLRVQTDFPGRGAQDEPLPRDSVPRRPDGSPRWAGGRSRRVGTGPRVQGSRGLGRAASSGTGATARHQRSH